MQSSSVANPSNCNNPSLVRIVEREAYIRFCNCCICTSILKINPDGIVKIADLGLTKDKADIHGTVCGTPLYMAP